MATKPKNQDLEIRQGGTFEQIVRWATKPIIYKVITGITQAAPVSITAVGHGVPNGWPVTIVSVKGMVEINAQNDPPLTADAKEATVLNVDTIQLNAVNAANFSLYKSGGYVQYDSPVDLTGSTAAMTIKDRVGGTVLETMTTTNGKIILDNTAKTIRLVLSAVTTAAYAWSTGVYDLEITSASGVVTPLLYGNVSLTKEITT